jgi:cytochrome P450
VVAKAPFLEAVCNETLRLRPALPAVVRTLRSPLNVCGYELPAGYKVSAHILWAHANPEVFPQPERFLPERFLQRSYTPFEFLPFGGGNRRCIGAAFALYEMKLVLGTLLQRYTFELASSKPVRVLQRPGLVPHVPVHVVVRPIQIPTRGTLAAA